MIDAIISPFFRVDKDAPGVNYSTGTSVDRSTVTTRIFERPLHLIPSFQSTPFLRAFENRDIRIPANVWHQIHGRVNTFVN